VVCVERKTAAMVWVLARVATSPDVPERYARIARTVLQMGAAPHANAKGQSAVQMYVISAKNVDYAVNAGAAKDPAAG